MYMLQCYNFFKFQHFLKKEYLLWTAVSAALSVLNRAFLSVSPGTLECPSKRALAEKCAQCSFPPRASSKDHNYLIKCKYINVSRPQLVPLTSTNQGHSSVTSICIYMMIYKHYDLLGVPCWNIAKTCKTMCFRLFSSTFTSQYTINRTEPHFLYG